MRDANYYHTPAPLAERVIIPGNWHANRPISDALKAATGSNAVAVVAYANHGRWIAECPTCHDAQLTAASDPRFMCTICGNAGIGGVWRPVIWPANYAQIGDLLDQRPPSLANALPGETLAQITAENISLLGVDK